MDALRFNSAESIWDLHSQPPLFNLYGAFFGRLFHPDHLWYMHYSDMVLGSLLSGMMWFIALEFSGSRPLAFVTALALSLNPALVLYEAYPLYTLLAAFLLVLTLFCLALFSLGKRWGPRYLLILMPIISWLGTLMLDATLRILRAGWRYAGSALFVLLFILGTYRNTYLGTVSLRDDYGERVLPALDLVQQHESRVVAVARQWISQELEAASDRKPVFRIQESEDLTTLGAGLFDQWHSGFLHLTLDYQERPTDLQFLSDDRHLMIKSGELGQYGSYLACEAAIGEHEATGRGSWDVHSAHP